MVNIEDTHYDTRPVRMSKQEQDELLHRYAVVKHVRCVLGAKLHQRVPRADRLQERYRSVDAEYKSLYPTASRIIDQRHAQVMSDTMNKYISEIIDNNHREPTTTTAEQIVLADLVRQALSKLPTDR